MKKLFKGLYQLTRLLYFIWVIYLWLGIIIRSIPFYVVILGLIIGGLVLPLMSAVTRNANAPSLHDLFNLFLKIFSPIYLVVLGATYLLLGVADFSVAAAVPDPAKGSVFGSAIAVIIAGVLCLWLDAVTVEKEIWQSGQQSSPPASRPRLQTQDLEQLDAIERAVWHPDLDPSSTSANVRFR